MAFLIGAFCVNKNDDSYSDSFLFLRKTDTFFKEFSRPSYLTCKQSLVLPKGIAFGYHNFEASVVTRQMSQAAACDGTKTTTTSIGQETATGTLAI